MTAHEDLAALVGQALAIIEQERAVGFNRARDAVRAVVNSCGESGLANTVYAIAPPVTPWRQIAEFLDIAIWETSDNGAEIMRDVERWLIEANDSRKTLVALHLDAYPFHLRSEMEAVLNEVARRLPETADRCAELVQSRRKLPE